MIGQPPFPLVPKETLPIGDSAGIYEDERGGYGFGRGNFRATYSSQAVNIPACAAKVVNGVPDIRIDPLSAPRRTRVLVALCEQLTSTKTCYPETNLVMRFSVKDRPGIS